MMNRKEHLLWILAEECNEVAHRVSKAARFGMDEVQPGQLYTNEARIVGEFADLLAVAEMLFKDTSFDLGPNMRSLIEAKKTKVEKYLLYSEKCGTLEPAGRNPDGRNERTDER